MDGSKVGDLKQWIFQMARKSEALDVGFSVGHSPEFIGAEFVSPLHNNSFPPQPYIT